MREEIDFARFHYLAQIGMRQSDRSGFRFVIHQRHQSRVLPVRKSHPAFNPILDPRGQFHVLRCRKESQDSHPRPTAPPIEGSAGRLAWKSST